MDRQTLTRRVQCVRESSRGSRMIPCVSVLNKTSFLLLSPTSSSKLEGSADGTNRK